MMKSNRLIPLSAFDDDNHIVGHLLIWYPEENGDSIVRFGFVIVDPAIRGCGNGKKMLQLAVGFSKQSVGRTEVYQMPVDEWECLEMELNAS